jgi:hypothetical protein
MERIGTAALSAMQSGSPSKQPMTEIVPITREDQLPLPFHREADRNIPDRILAWTGSNGVAELRRPLTDDERGTLARRVSELLSALAPWPKQSGDELKGEISLMLNVPANRGLDERAAMGFVLQYLQLCRNRPHWAIVKVCRNVRLGKAGLSPAYCPTEAEFNRLIDQEVAAFERALRRGRAILEAKALPSDPPKPTQAEIEAKLGRTISGAEEKESEARPSADAGDGNHAARVMAELAARKARRESAA